MVSRTRIGFVGFGEAGFYISKGLKGAGADVVCAYDIHANTAGLGEKIRARAEDSGTTLVASSEELTSKTEILLSTVTADAAEEAAGQTAPHLNSRHIYADLNSVSPQAKQTIEAIVTGAGAAFVEAAIMGPVPPTGHQTPMLLGGPQAPVFVERLAPYGMSLEVVSDQTGSAAAVKMCRSIVVKGLEALIIESSMAASEYGADKRVFDSLSESFPGIDWGRLADYMVGRVVVHGERRAREMDEVARMLTAIGIDPIMAAAAARRQDWCARLGLREAFGDSPPEDHREVVETIRRRAKSAASETTD